MAGMSNIKEVHSKPRLYVSVLSTYFLEYGRHVARLRRRAYAPTSNTASHDNLKEFPFRSHDDYGAPLGGPSGRRSSAIKDYKSLYVNIYAIGLRKLKYCQVVKIKIPDFTSFCLTAYSAETQNEATSNLTIAP